MKNLTNQEILNLAPSIGAIHPHEKVSSKYTFIPTIQIVDMLRAENWRPVKVQQSGAWKAENQGFQKHLIRFQRPDLIVENEAVEIILLNSHNRSCAYQLMAGVFRFVCSNGMVVGDTFNRMSIRHISNPAEEVIEASYKVIKEAPVIAGSFKKMKKIGLDVAERETYASAALQLVYDDVKESPVSVQQILRPRRTADHEPDLWTTFNVVQENIIKGGLRGVSRKTGKRVTTRPVKSIDRDVKLNKALWTLTEKMKELKQ